MTDKLIEVLDSFDRRLTKVEECQIFIIKLLKEAMQKEAGGR